jgi:hypothetical protein
VYAASDVAGVFRSTDNGDHWQMQSLGLGNYEVSSFAVDPFDSNTLYAGVCRQRVAQASVSHRQPSRSLSRAGHGRGFSGEVGW